MDINKILKEHNASVEDYIYERSETNKEVKDILLFLENMKDRIGNFGYGRTTFHTADVNLLLMIAEEVVKEELVGGKK